MNARSLVLPMIVTVLAIACATPKPAVRPEATTVSPEALRRDRARRVVATPQPPRPGPPVVAGKGDCAPPSEKRSTRSACCNDRPCVGDCVETAPGTIECDCFGTRGGCAAGLVCCQVRRACVKPEECWVP